MHNSVLDRVVARHRMNDAVRHFFSARDYLEVETPVRVQYPALEDHIDAEPSGDWYLRTSPELHMKRLLAAGCERIFQLAPCFRHSEFGAHHHPEYTMLEWYRTHTDYMGILEETQALFRFVAEAFGPQSFHGRVDVFAEWEMLTVEEAFRRFAGWNPVAHFDADRFDIDLVERVEPQLPKEVPVVLIDYPAPLGALARLKKENAAVAERWEVYLNGVELANAYSELTDPVEQRQRFEACAKGRARRGQAVYAADEAFITALHHVPDAGGIAVGMDRLQMLLQGLNSLDDVLPFRYVEGYTNE